MTRGQQIAFALFALALMILAALLAVGAGQMLAESEAVISWR